MRFVNISLSLCPELLSLRHIWALVGKSSSDETDYTL